MTFVTFTKVDSFLVKSPEAANSLNSLKILWTFWLAKLCFVKVSSFKAHYRVSLFQTCKGPGNYFEKERVRNRNKMAQSPYESTVFFYLITVLVRSTSITSTHSYLSCLVVLVSPPLVFDYSISALFSHSQWPYGHS